MYQVVVEDYGKVGQGIRQNWFLRSCVDHDARTHHPGLVELVQEQELEPLGVDTELDKSYLIQSKKASERKAVKKAYEEAILHR